MTTPPQVSIRTLRQVFRLALWAVEREASMTLPQGRSEAFGLFAEQVRSAIAEETRE